MADFVSYYRVSTARQQRSGLGLEAQRKSVADALKQGDRIVAEFTEIESGRNNARPALAEAIARCKLTRSTLIVAKLDRLARNVAFISTLMETGVPFVASDNPHATNFTVHILASVAEHEAKLISDRTKAALAAAKARGVRLGGYRGDIPNREAGQAASRAMRSRASTERSTAILPLIFEANAAGATSVRQIASWLNEKGIKAPRGGDWHAGSVARVIGR